MNLASFYSRLWSAHVCANPPLTLSREADPRLHDITRPAETTPAPESPGSQKSS